MGELNSIENYEHYWELINSIRELCEEAMEEGNLFCEDVISALDRVKFHWLVDHIQCRFNLETEDDNEKENKGEDE